jgi:hypothetical protein
MPIGQLKILLLSVCLGLAVADPLPGGADSVKGLVTDIVLDLAGVLASGIWVHTQVNQEV